MCGVVGFFSTREGWALSEGQLAAMRDTMKSRGPDDAGLLIQKGSGWYAGLGHRRLSIIDLSPSGRQPMSTEDRSLSIVFNGEIFNYRELREALLQTGKYRFQSKSDTEVILYALREWDLEGCLKRLRGMYAFALFDQSNRSLTLVRDPLGVKPLYYFRPHPGIIVFASEIKALLLLPGFKKNINAQSLYHYLTFANVPAPHTLFEGVYKLEAGTFLTVDSKGSVRQKRYWDPTRFQPENGMEESEAVSEIRRLLRQSVSRRMISDVPFGVFLSGGVDSSLNVALMAEQMNQPVETFSVGIKDDPSNEFESARRVARRFGTRHHELLIDDDDFISFLPEMAHAQDEPLADPVCVPLYYVSKLARESGVTVIQVGEGSDEIFAGYRMYHQFNGWDKNYYQPYLRLPASFRSLLHRTLKGWLSSEKKDALRRSIDREPLFIGNAVAFWDGEKERLWRGPSSFSTSSSYIAHLVKDSEIDDPLCSIINVELKNRLPELLLMRVDKMSMANSIETRVPFLDEDLVEFALSIPSALKFQNNEPKYILKKAAEGILPNEIIYRKKWGFCGSATNIVNNRLVAYAYPKVMESPLIKEFFDRRPIEKLFESYREKKRFNSFKIWNLLNLVLWHSCWFE